ncbi:MAG: peptidase M50 [Gammaproteobacteria bacterium]
MDTLWTHLAPLRLRLADHTRLQPRDHRGHRDYVLSDGLGARRLLVSEALAPLLQSLDGSLSLAEAYDRLQSPPPLEELTQTLAQLLATGLLVGQVPAPLRQYLREALPAARPAGGGFNPLAIRLPLFDPNRLLDRLSPVLTPLFGPAGALVWLIAVASALVAAALHWPELSTDVVDRLLAAGNLPLLLLCYVGMKALHELGHAAVIKRYGGEVHECGVMLLALLPVAYVDASAASDFPQRRQRILVSLAGVAVELFISAVALGCWVYAENGSWFSAVAYNLLLIGTLSTLLFNLNPLARFDGYYALTDWIEIPNLASRAARYYSYLTQRYLLRLEDSVSPAQTPGERRWYQGYGAAAFCYRWYILFWILLLLAQRQPLLGLGLAVWAGVFLLARPLVRYLHFLLRDARLAPRRAQGLLVGAVLPGLALLAVLLSPLPSRTVAQGVVIAPAQAELLAGTEGFVEQIQVDEAAAVAPGAVLLTLSNAILSAGHDTLQAQRRQLQAQHDAARLKDRGEAAIFTDRLDTVEAELARLAQHLAGLQLRSPVAGSVVLLDGADLPGRFVRRGELLGYVLDGRPMQLRVVVPQSAAGGLRRGVVAVEVRLAERPGTVLRASILHEVPAANRRLASAALGTGGGGEILTDPSDPRGLTALHEVVEYTVELPPVPAHIGARAQVRFTHPSESLAGRAYRGLHRRLQEQADV